MHYSFDVEDAITYGQEEAVILHNIKHWVLKNEANGKHSHEDRYWTYNSAEAFQELFPFWTLKQIRRILTSLEVKGAIITGNFNISGYDRTKWYGLSDKVLFQMGKCIFPNGQMEVTERENGSSQKGEPIPDSKPDNKHINESFEIFWKKYDKKKGKEAAVKYWRSLKDKERKSAIDYIPKYIKDFPDKQFRKDPERYLKYKLWKDDETIDSSSRKLIGHYHTRNLANEPVTLPVYEGDKIPKIGFVPVK